MHILAEHVQLVTGNAVHNCGYDAVICYRFAIHVRGDILDSLSQKYVSPAVLGTINNDVLKYIATGT